jgi:DinB superfamily
MATRTTPDLAGVLSIEFQFTGGAFLRNMKDITHAESLERPIPDANCANWIVGHLVSSRNQILSLLGLPPVRSQEEMTHYVRGSAPLTEPADAIDLRELLSDFAKAQDRIVEALSRIRPEQLAAPLPADANPFRLDNTAEMLVGLAFHESYHVGQLGILRRALGKEPAIR